MQQTCLTFVCLSASCADMCVCDEIKSNQCSMLSDHLVWPYVLCSYLDSVLSLWPNRLRIKPTEARVSVYRQSRSSVSVFDHCYHMCVFAELLWSPHHIYKCDRIGEDYLITITWEEKSLMRSLKYLKCFTYTEMRFLHSKVLSMNSIISHQHLNKSFF